MPYLYIDSSHDTTDQNTVLKNNVLALANVAQLVGCCPGHPKVARCMQEAANVLLSH